MCGIAGIVGHGGGAPVDERTLVRLRDAQAHRGPDDAGTWIDGRRQVGLAHRRLSIIDLTASGHQPMSTADGQLHLVFNGEIYNHLELRKTLEGRGHRFRSSSDSEVLLHGYREWGEDLLPRLRGMFAFALFDQPADAVLLARDPLGIKPLHVADFDDFAVFSSEVQPIRRVFGSGGNDLEAVISYLHWGSIAAPRTLYKKIRALPAGHRTWIRSGKLRESSPYYSLREEIQEISPNMSEGEAEERIRAALLDSVQCHMVADVEVGSFLSGGVDSISLVSLMSEVLPRPVSTINLSFDIAAMDEGELAQRAATELGAHHQRIDLTADDARESIADAVGSLDQPSGDGINVGLVSRAAVQSGLKVAVNGVGGDELFGGYSTFGALDRVRNIHRRLSRLPATESLRRLALFGIQRLPPSQQRSGIRRALQHGETLAGAYFSVRGLFSAEQAAGLLARDARAVVEHIDPVAELNARTRPGEVPAEQQMAYLEVQQYLQMQLLRDADIMSMKHSLEIRTPLVDHVLYRELFKIPAALRQAGPAKRRLREATRPPLAERYWKRKKMGFVLPWEDWMRAKEFQWALPQHEIFDSDALKGLETSFLRRQTSSSRVWALVALVPFLD
ncbi:MAG TPA: asparagine synthase (glutamine-hydrolyzing) [Myxococcales bacterium]|nr:asparagine synthase (glutamine-hydrolyzing) [Myxococcales bacterium]